MKWVYAFLTALSFLFVQPALALPPETKPRPPLALQSELKLMGHVTDPGNRLTQFDRMELEKKIAELQVDYHTDLPVFLAQDLAGESLQAVAEKNFRAWKIGRGWDTGALLAISLDDEAYLQMGPGIGYPVSAAEAAQITAQFKQAIAGGGLRGAIDFTIDAVTSKIREVDGTLPRNPGRANDRYKVHFYSAFLVLMAGLFFTTFWRMRHTTIPPATTRPTSSSSILLDGLFRLIGWPSKRPAWFDVLVLTGVALALRMCWLSKPADSHIFDEAYYIQDARVILGLPVRAHDLPQEALSFLDPNREHPPLGKLLIALAMHLCGDNSWGQRIASVIFGTGCIPLVYLIVRRLGGKHGVAMIAGYLLALDNLSLVHSRIATLDIFYVFFGLCGVYAYAAGLIELAAFSLAVATNCKLPGLFGFAALIGFELARTGVAWLGTRTWSTRPLKNLAVLSVWYVGGTLILLGALDATVTRFVTPIDHIKHIFAFGAQLTHEIPQGIESKPWQWMINETQIPYIEMREPVGELMKLTVNFRGALNPYIIFFAPVALAYAAARGIRRKEDLSLLALALFLGTYAPYWVIWIKSSRICYLYYFLQTVPALAIANAILVQSLRPRIVRTAYLLTVAFGTWAYFPFLQIP